MDENNRLEALAIFNKYCSYLDAQNWNYEKDEDKFLVVYNVTGEDLPMRFLVVLEPELGIIRIISELPFEVSEDKIVDLNLAVTAVNDHIMNGCFLVSPHSVLFKVASSYYFDEVDDNLFDYLMSVSINVVEKYNDKFFALEKGYVSLNDFIKQLD